MTIRKYWKNYYDLKDGVIWVIDSGDQTRMEESKNELITILDDKNLEKADFLILFNKQDKENALSFEENQKIFDFEKISSNRQIKAFPCSANNTESVMKVIKWLIETIKIKKNGLED